MYLEILLACLLFSAACTTDEDTVAEPQMFERVVLLPLDSRPACVDMPMAMGRIAGVEVVVPPRALLGEFRQPGKCEELGAWLMRSVEARTDAVIVSSDMLCYGGLVPSRVGEVSLEVALERLRLLERIAQERPDIPVYVFGSIMRTAPTATKEASKWRLELAKYLYYRDRYRATGSSGAKAKAREHLANVPKGELANYERTRERNLKVLRHLVGFLKSGAIDFLVFGQDDAEPFGPHRLERVALRNLLDREGLSGRAMICGGIDQIACALLSRALSRSRGATPRVWVEWSGEAGKSYVAPNEGQSCEEAAFSQIFGAGARPASSRLEADIVLWINSYRRTEEEFTQFLRALSEDIETGRAVALADLNLDAAGVADPALVRFLLETKRCADLAGYAGWNTVSNTLGTALPQAIVYWLSLRDPRIDPRARGIARAEFILQRLVAEYGYHHYIRPQAYEYLKNDLRAAKEEVYGDDLEKLERFVMKHTEKVLRTFFKMGFQGTQLAVGADGERMILSELRNVRIELPWPRAYEVRISFGFGTASGTPEMSGASKR